MPLYPYHLYRSPLRGLTRISQVGVQCASSETMRYLTHNSVAVLDTPLGRALDIVGDDDQVIWKASLEESEEDGDPAGEHARTIGAWHGLSKEGEAIVRDSGFWNIS
jgi:hypothetical protein